MSVIDKAMLVIVRFAGTCKRERHELALCHPMSDGRVRVMYLGREAICDQEELVAALPLTYHNLITRAFVMGCAEVSYAKMAHNFRDYEEVRPPHPPLLTAYCSTPCRHAMVSSLTS